MNSIFKINKIICRIIFLYPLYIISKFIKKKNDVWVFGSANNAFSDNSKYLFLYIVKNYPSINAIWITGDKKLLQELREKGFKAEYRWSLKGLLLSLKAKVYIYSTYSSDINYWTSAGAIKFNLWHGIPLKKIQYDIRVGKLGKKYNSLYTFFYKILFPSSFQKPDYILSTSSFISEIFSSAFKIKKEQCVEFGFPRCDHFFLKQSDLLDFINTVAIETNRYIRKIGKYNKTIIYLPTFREQGTNDIEEIWDLRYLNEVLDKKNFLLFIKQHPNIKNSVERKFSNIIFLDPKIDIYTILPFTDLLITDYSSVMFDYMLLNKPILFYAYDKENYISNERGFYMDYDHLVKGNIICDFDMLVERICRNFGDIGVMEEEKEKYWGNYNGNASEKIINFIKGKARCMY